jgi:membrane protease subunit HflC
MNPKTFLYGGLVALTLAPLLLKQVFLIVDESEQVIITRFGEYIRTIQNPGLAIKVPILHSATRFDRRILVSEAPEAEYLSQDKKRLVADPVTRWRIADPLLFFKTVRDESGARSRLDDLVFSELRREVANHPFATVIGAKRESIMDAVATSVRANAAGFGIAVVDVRIRRADLPKEVQQSVFARMQAEREEEAKRYRSEGEEEANKLRAQTDKERTIVLADAEYNAQKLRGEGDATATRIYAEAYGKDPEFYRFVRSLQSYERFLGKRSTLVLSAESPLFHYMGGPRPGAGKTSPAAAPVSLTATEARK